MTILSKQLRGQLKTAIERAREIAEDATKEAIARMGVAEAEAPAYLSDANKALRRRLRAHARTVGDVRDAAGAMTTMRLQDAASYEIWHRMLFGRFLAERGLLIHPDLGAAMSVAELRDLAQEDGATDEWTLAERYAAPGLPGVFKPDDPVLALPIAPEFSKRLRAVLSGLPEAVFTADDSLGWTYQFWRASEKDAVNAAGVKIGAAELSAVTQLFTEPYMVKFLLHNTLGAWWAGKVLARDPNLAREAADEDLLRNACALPGVEWEFLRFVRDTNGDGYWRPAAGTFPGWPKRAAEITYCDPCCGSGHFLVEAFFIMVALRQNEEELSVENAAVAVLSDNLHGLEIDGRCVQIAAFNVALAAWKFASAPIPLPSPHIAWVGAPPPMSRLEMAALADGDESLRRALERLHDQFAQAPVIGSLLQIGAQDLLDADLRERGEAALAKLRVAEPERAEGAVAARGLLDASALLGRHYVLLATNVPFLGTKKQGPILAAYIERHFERSKTDLATAMLDRMCDLAEPNGAIASVTPQNWLFLGGYTAMREVLVASSSLSFVVVLGEHGFDSNAAAGAFTALICLRNTAPSADTTFAGIDANSARNPDEKALLIRDKAPKTVMQSAQRKNPDTRISIEASLVGKLLQEYAYSYQGLSTGDNFRFRRCHWEVGSLSPRWVPEQSTVDASVHYGGRRGILLWDNGRGDLHRFGRENVATLHNVDRRGEEAWGRVGVAISQMRQLPASIFTGQHFDTNVAVIVPHDPDELTAIWTFCSSNEYVEAVRRIDRKVNVTNSTLVKIPYDIDRWRSVAAETYPEGLPKPYSDDPTQWLFHGHPAFSEAGTELHVALARLAGYRWPAETSTKMQLSNVAKERSALASALPGVDTDGLVLMHGYGDARPLADRLRGFLAAAYGCPLSPTQELALIRSADLKLDKKEARDNTLEAWLADRAFRQHCLLFSNKDGHARPFLWHIGDGMKDGFSVIVHYHRFDRAALDKLTYTLLGDWMRTARAEGNNARLERAGQLQQKLVKIIEGDNPYDIFVRWKPLAKQPIGWDPDLDDGVRLNIRPFITAGVLREQPRGISWNKDRGSDISSAPWFDLGPQYGGKPGDRINDHHTTLAEKRVARGTS